MLRILTLVAVLIIAAPSQADDAKARAAWAWAGADATKADYDDGAKAAWAWTSVSLVLEPVVIPPPDGKPSLVDAAELQRRAYRDLYERAKQSGELVAVYVNADPPRDGVGVPSCRYDAGMAGEKEPVVLYGRFDGDTFRRVGQYYLNRPQVTWAAPSYFTNSLPMVRSNCPGGQCPIR